MLFVKYRTEVLVHAEHSASASYYYPFPLPSFIGSFVYSARIC